MKASQQTVEEIIAESDRRDVRNRQLARSFAIAFATFLLVVCIAQRQFPSIWYATVVASLTFLASQSHTRLIHSGWAFVGLLFLAIYIPTIGPHSYSWHDVADAFIRTLAANSTVLMEGSAHFKDAYIILGSAAFTLYGFFFLATKRVARIEVGVRLYTIAQVFGTVLTLAVTATLLPNSGWWRYGTLLIIAAGALYALGREPRPYLINSRIDRPGMASFWDGWLRNRTGQAILSFTGLFLMPLWPVAGEVLFVFGLLYLLIIAAWTSTYLYLASELPNTASTDEQLRLLYNFRVNPDFSDLPYKPIGIRGMHLNRESVVKTMPFTFPRPPSS